MRARSGRHTACTTWPDLCSSEARPNKHGKAARLKASFPPFKRALHDQAVPLEHPVRPDAALQSADTGITSWDPRVTHRHARTGCPPCAPLAQRAA